MRQLLQCAAIRSLLAPATCNQAIHTAVCQPNAKWLGHSTQPQLVFSPVLAAATFAKSFATDLKGSEGPHRVPNEDRLTSNASASTSQLAEQPDSGDDWDERWAKLSEKGDLVGQADLLRDVFGEIPEPVGPPLHELLSYSRKEEERAKRREFELQKQEEIRQSRCVMLSVH